MTSTRTRLLLIPAALVSGLLAGLDFDRSLVAMPAWVLVGPAAWAEFSRHADLGAGLVLYPLEAIGAALLTLAAALSLWRDGAASRLAGLALAAASLLAIGGLGLTFKAAPLMLGIRDATDPAALRRAFEGFRYWGDLRGICQVGAFLAQLVALAALRPRPR
jgi:hypothetical protein